MCSNERTNPVVEDSSKPVLERDDVMDTASAAHPSARATSNRMKIEIAYGFTRDTNCHTRTHTHTHTHQKKIRMDERTNDGTNELEKEGSDSCVLNFV